MPSIVGGPVKIVSITSGGTVNMGDTGFIAPKNSTKSYAGSGGSLTGDFSMSFNGISNVNTLDPDVIDNNTRSGI